MNRFRNILISVEACAYLLIAILSILSITGQVSYWDQMQSKTILVASVACFLGVFATTIAEKVTRFRFSILVDICIAVDLFLSIIVGECFQGYYKIPAYDKILHFIGTLQIAILGYAIAKYFLRKHSTSKKQLVMALFFAFFFAIAIEALWELYEWGADSLFGTNMQKYIPDQFLDNLDENMRIPESLYDELIAFYSTKEGYHYAIMDTMGDVVADTLGSLTGVVSMYFVFVKHEELQDRLIYVEGEFSSLAEEGEKEPKENIR